MVALSPEVLLPGHGVPVVGADRVREALTSTAELLESLHEQTLAMMNAGARLDEIIHSVRAPSHLLEKPYLRPVYDDPEFIVRNTWRLYGGWYDGNPARLKPAPDAVLAAEVASLAGGVDAEQRELGEQHAHQQEQHGERHEGTSPGSLQIYPSAPSDNRSDSATAHENTPFAIVDGSSATRRRLTSARTRCTPASVGAASAASSAR